MDKEAKRIERYFKGVSNHWRIAILWEIAKNPSITVNGISENLKANFKTISEHIRRLKLSGLINKKYRGKTVAHTLSPYGKKFLKFTKSFLDS
ncbi:MAG: winged helix-turn-helix domain-containing protein [Patescibacteria group bacterium]